MQKDMIIDGMTRERLQGAVSQFMFKGYLISNSQMFKGNEIAIFKGDDMVGSRFNTVEAAIDYVLGLEKPSDYGLHLDSLHPNVQQYVK